MISAHVPTLFIYCSPRLSIGRRDRRRYQRFPIIARVEYILNGHRAQATTVDIGSGGVLLKTDAILRAGQKITVLIDWPVLLDHRLPIRLVIFGKVLRSDWAGTVVQLTRYDFRIRAQDRLVRSVNSATLQRGANGC